MLKRVLHHVFIPVIFIAGFFNLAAAQTASNILTLQTLPAANGVHAGERFRFALRVQIAENWHINSNQPLDDLSIKTRLTFTENQDFQIEAVQFPEHELKRLSFSNTPLALFTEEFIIVVSGIVSEGVQDSLIIQGQLHYQGCNNDICLPPDEKSFRFRIPVLASEAPLIFLNSELFDRISSQTKVPDAQTFNISESFARKGIILTFILIFLGGLALNLTPCIYPLIPITVSYFGGQTANQTGKRLIMAILYVLGIALINSALGTLAALSGSLLGSFMTNPVVLLIIAAILILLALSMFGVYEFRLPGFLNQLAGNSQSGYFGALLMGLTMGIVAAPCIGPFVLGLLTYVASTGNPSLGFAMFFTLSLGLGLPFILLAFFSSKINQLPRAGEWMVGVRIIFGLVLVGMAFYFTGPLMPGRLFHYLFPIYLLGAGIYLILLNRSGSRLKVFGFIKKLLALIVIIIGVWLLRPGAGKTALMEWEYFNLTNYEQALQSENPVILDFSADWCIPCKEMDKITFTDPQIVELSTKFKLIKVDLTSGTSPETERLKKQFQVRGVPTIVFLDSAGNELSNLRTIGFEKPDGFKQKMETALRP
jgi:thiol:disulfide interchange protein DsbD